MLKSQAIWKWSEHYIHSRWNQNKIDRYLKALVQLVKRCFRKSQNDQLLSDQTNWREKTKKWKKISLPFNERKIMWFEHLLRTTVTPKIWATNRFFSIEKREIAANYSFKHLDPNRIRVETHKANQIQLQTISHSSFHLYFVTSFARRFQFFALHLFLFQLFAFSFSIIIIDLLIVLKVEQLPLPMHLANNTSHLKCKLDTRLHNVQCAHQ